MKTTVKLGTARQIEVEPMKFSTGLHLCITDKPGQEKIFISLTPDQAGALIFGMEQALEVIDQRHKQALETMRAAA